MNDATLPPARPDEPFVASPARLPVLRFAKRWAAVAVRFFSLQVLGQALGFATGLLLIRSLTKSEYGFYTIFNTLLSTVGLLADIGVTSALMAVGGTIWQDNARLSRLIASGFYVRKRMALASFAIVGVVAVVTLMRAGTNATQTILLGLLMIACASVTLTTDVLIVAPRIQGEITSLQWIGLAGGATRLALIALCLFGSFTVVWAAGATFLSVLVQLTLMRRLTAGRVDLSAPVDFEYIGVIWKNITRLAPGTIYYCLQGQIILFLASYIGRSERVAEIGAVGRLAVLLDVLGAFIGSVILPRYARCQERQKALRIFGGAVSFYLIFGGVTVLLSAVAPRVFIAIIGTKYQNVMSDLPYLLSGTCLGVLGGVVYSMNVSRMWNKSVTLTTICTIVIQIVCLTQLSLGSIRGIAWFSIISALPPLLIYTVDNVRQTLRMSSRPAPALT